MAEPSPKEQFRAAADVLSQLATPTPVVSPVLQDAMDPDPVLRAALSKARDELGPSVRGLHALSRVSRAIGATALADVIDLVMVAREKRVSLIQSALDALDAVITARRVLEADGFPDVPEKTIEAALFVQLSEEIADFLAAFSVFKPDTTKASKITITFGAPVPKA